MSAIPECTATVRVADVDRIRSAVPALRRKEAGYPVGYFDGPGGTQVPEPVLRAATEYLMRHNANRRWAYPSSAETDEAVESARVVMADFLGSSPREVVFGANMTTLTFHLSRALGRGLVRGDEIVVTDLDHQANVAPWRVLEEERGVIIRTVPMVRETGDLDWDRFQALLSPETRIVAIGAASNALGTVVDVRRAVQLSKAVDALVFVDAVHLAPHERLRVRELDCDFLACSAYKFYGPHVGVLYGREALIHGLDVPRLPPAPNRSPDRLETGTLNHEGIVGAAAAVDFLASLAEGDTRARRLDVVFQGLLHRGEQLVRRMWEGLARVPGVRLYGPPPGNPRTPTVAFTVEDVSPRTVVSRLARDFGLFLSHGDFYASTVVDALGLRAKGGLIRAGCACYTTEEEVDRLVEAVGGISRRS
jgi:cysteine desulfurase family protein (TIGR01976 family)